MSKIEIIFGSSTGNTEAVAHMIAAALSRTAVETRNITACRRVDFETADRLILGLSTWENGALQKDWQAFFPQLDMLDLSGKQVALFGLGDANGFASRFVNALRTLYDKVVERGAEVVGFWPTEGYGFVESTAVIGDHFVGLVIDQENASDKTVERIGAWVAQLKHEFGVDYKADEGDPLRPFAMAC